MTTGGEGGLLVTNDSSLWQKAWEFKDHGKSYDAVYNREHAPRFRWLHESFGTNWRMTEMQSAIGRLQLKKISEWVSLRKRNADIVTHAFSSIPSLRLTIPPDHIKHAYQKYYAFVRPEMLKPDWSRDRIIVAMNEQGIPCFSGRCSEIYLEKAFENQGLRPSTRLPIAKELGETSLMFLVHPTLTEENMNTAANALKTVMAEATR